MSMTSRDVGRVELRRMRVAEWLLEGLTTRQMAARAGVSSHTTILDDIRVVKAEWRAARFANFDDYVATELAKLLVLERAHWPMARRGEHAATAEILRIIDLRAKLVGLHERIDPMEALRAMAERDGIEPGPVLAEAERILGVLRP